MLVITAIAASILSFLYIKLTIEVVKHRKRNEISVGDGENEVLLRAIRTHGNLTEYAPIALILIACMELNNAPWLLTAILATAFVVGRILHPMGMKIGDGSINLRANGMKLTLLSLIALGASNLIVLAWRLIAG